LTIIAGTLNMRFYKVTFIFDENGLFLASMKSTKTKKFFRNEKSHH